MRFLNTFHFCNTYWDKEKWKINLRLRNRVYMKEIFYMLSAIRKGLLFTIIIKWILENYLTIFSNSSPFSNHVLPNSPNSTVDILSPPMIPNKKFTNLHCIANYAGTTNLSEQCYYFGLLHGVLPLAQQASPVSTIWAFSSWEVGRPDQLAASSTITSTEISIRKLNAQKRDL